MASINPITPAENKSSKSIFEGNLAAIFWAIYLSFYGYEQYLAINNKYGNVELEEKQKIMNFLKTGYSKMKEVSKKTSKTLMQEWMSELMSASKMSLSILQVFSVYYQRPIIIYIESIHAHLKFYESNEFLRT